MEGKYRMIDRRKDEHRDEGQREMYSKSLSPVPDQPFIADRPSTAGSSYKAYSCFALSCLFKDLFSGGEHTDFFSNKPLIKNIPDKTKEIFSFIFPKTIRKQIESKDNNIKRARAIKEKKDTIKENHYSHFCQLRYHDNVITNFIYEIYAELGWKNFISSIREHIAEQLDGMPLCGSKEREKLIEYLETVGDYPIVPRDVSQKSNEEFKRLIEKGKEDNQALILIISNFFVSCVLGLRSMKFPSDTGRGKKPSFKTYLLSEFGMECIWTPDLITSPHERLLDSQRLFENSNFNRAIDAAQAWLQESETNALPEDKARAYKILGLSLCSLSSSDDDNRRSEGIDYLTKCARTGRADLRVLYSLYHYLKEKEPAKAAEYLRRAFDQDYAKAVVEAASAHLNGTELLEEVTPEDLCAKIDKIIEDERRNNVADVGKCLYLRGKLESDSDEAQRYFTRAAKKGNERAKQELIRQERAAERSNLSSFSQAQNVGCCFANTLTGLNYQVLSTFPDNEWALFAPVQTSLNGIQYAHDIEEFINSQHIGGTSFCRPKMVFLFMSKDKEKNLSDCLELLDKLFNAALKMAEAQKWELIDRTHICVYANYETASMLIDANISQMGNDIYFKVHIADENRDTVHKLLCEAPLFLPALNGAKSESFTSVVLFGNSEMNYAFIKESVASAYSGAEHRIDITLLGENADALENRFRQECPGMFSCPDLTCIRPEFIKCRIKETNFPDCIFGKARNDALSTKESEKDSLSVSIARKLLRGNYFVVDFADDLENIRFAMELRTWLLRSRDSFDRTPFIAVKVSDKQNSYLTSHLTLAGQAAGNSFYNQYDLFPFGISAQTYHYKNIIEEPILNRIALQIHKLYYLDDDVDKNDERKLQKALEECCRAAENDFYSYSYNADSSASNAIGLCYRFFAAGCVLTSKEDYMDFGVFKKRELLSKFSEQLNNKTIESLARLETTRWNSFMLIRGWLPANETQVKNYLEQSSGIAHKHVLAKLHPFIDEWENLDCSRLKKLLPIFEARVHYKKTPQVTGKKNIEDTVRYFRVESKETEKER